MPQNETPSAERLHIGFFGLRNAGKSSLVNAVTGQELALVSEVKGTTTDPVKKAMELLPLGPVVIVDTPGLDDEGYLGDMRVKKAKEALAYTDIAVLVVDAAAGMQPLERELLTVLADKNIPCIIAYNKADLLPEYPKQTDNSIYVSALTKENIYELKEMLGRLGKETKNEKMILADLVSSGDTAVLVTPIDASAPKGRLILPQQQTLRELLDIGAIAVVCKETELARALAQLKEKPKLVVTDSQVFGKVSKVTPPDVPLTSFSILFARYKGSLPTAVQGAAKLDRLKDGDKVLIAEGCTHHRQCEDIGTVKIPAWVRDYTGKSIEFEFCSGTEFPEELSKYALVIHCGGCMLNEKAMRSRIERAVRVGIPITNYGIAIALMHGILRRSLMPFPQIAQLLDRVE